MHITGVGVLESSRVAACSSLSETQGLLSRHCGVFRAGLGLLHVTRGTCRKNLVRNFDTKIAKQRSNYSFHTIHKILKCIIFSQQVQGRYSTHIVLQTLVLYWLLDICDFEALVHGAVQVGLTE